MFWVSLHLLSENSPSRKKAARHHHTNTHVLVKPLRFCPILTKAFLSLQILTEVPNIKYHEKPSNGSRVVTCGWTDIRTGMIKLLQNAWFFIGGGVSGAGWWAYLACEVTRGGCSYAWNFSVTRSDVPVEAKRRTRPTWRCPSINDSLLAYRLNIPPATNNALPYNSRLSQLRKCV
jgi:hypothetical protein